MFLPGEFQGRWTLVGCRLWSCTELDTTEVTQQQQQQQQQQQRSTETAHFSVDSLFCFKTVLCSWLRDVSVINSAFDRSVAPLDARGYTPRSGWAVASHPLPAPSLHVAEVGGKGGTVP